MDKKYLLFANQYGKFYLWNCLQKLPYEIKMVSSKNADAVFCFVCRQFGKPTSKDDVFMKTGFRSWKIALQKNKGFDKHNNSSQHIANMVSWKKKEARRKTSTQVSRLLTSDVIEKRQYYVISLIGVVKLLASNELPFRGEWDPDTQSESGLFSKILKCTLKKDERLKPCLDVIPKNATYTSAEIQNELIGIMADFVRELIVEEVNSASAFTLLVDGTKDRNKNEIISIATRYVIGSIPKESLISFEKSECLCAEPMTNFILEKLREFSLKLEQLLSQCYDGANVMSGEDGGIQGILQRKLNQIIPYVHCFNHRLHLVVMTAIEHIDAPSLFFGQIKMIYNFFSKWKDKQLYEGTVISRVIETRWSGHKRSLDAVYGNYKD